MNLDKLFDKYEEIEYTLNDLIEYMKDIQYPDLIVEEKQIPQELKKIEALEKKDIAPLTGGEKSRLHENIVEYYVFDRDEDFTPLIPQKYVSYEKEKLAPGLFVVTSEYGIKGRKGDYRFTEKVNVQKDKSYFLYENNQYSQVNPQKQQWLDRLAEREELRKQSVEFIYFYKDLQNAIWTKKLNPFDKGKFIYGFSQEINSMGEIEFIETMNFFLRISELYLFILQFFGSITKDEFSYLLKAIDRQKDRNYNCYEYIMLKEEELLFDFASVLNLSNGDPFFETKFKMAVLLTPREERLDIITTANYHQGYVYIDVEKGICYPNLGELDRRINLFQLAANAESEREIVKSIIKIAKQQKK
ncbi:hypothetical protein [Neobacillus cucumis]|uniref:Uncharacterized protein n=1 Tax=Neobacillus cucumis TaxID=1740721 RepID=A0A2N5H8V7_9BACI|nr:hypothetical protein [Neobacillus cucumis]PLS01941.1 hypothetical protein CVD27_22760 [Neobacillus cucumis]